MSNLIKKIYETVFPKCKTCSYRTFRRIHRVVDPNGVVTDVCSTFGCAQKNLLDFEARCRKKKDGEL